MTTQDTVFQDTFALELVTRCCLIQQAMDSHILAHPFFFLAVQQPIFPQFFNRTFRENSRPNGHPIRLDVYRVVMRAVWGTTASMEQNEAETLALSYYTRVLNAFDAQLKLGDPNNNYEPLRYVKKAQILPGDPGIVGVYQEQGAQRPAYYVTDYPLQVEAEFMVGRRS